MRRLAATFGGDPRRRDCANATASAWSAGGIGAPTGGFAYLR
jgi:hypothetical protein